MENFNNSLLLKQLETCFNNDIPKNLIPFIKQVNTTYNDFQESIVMLDKTLEKRTDELIIAQEELRELSGAETE